MKCVPGWICLIVLAGMVLALDQASKWYVLQVLNLPDIGRMDVFSGFRLSMAWNRGINFGILASGAPQAQMILIGLSVAISGALAVWALRTGTAAAITGAGLIIGGALGNALDRWLYGAVADFLNVSCCGINNPYAFNVADVAIFAGAAVLIVFSSPSRT